MDVLLLAWIVLAIPTVVFGLIGMDDVYSDIRRQGYADKQDRRNLRKAWGLIGLGLLAPITAPIAAVWVAGVLSVKAKRSLKLAFGRTKELENE